MDLDPSTCAVCRRPVALDQRYCLACGHRLRAPVVDWRPPAVATARQAAAAPTARRRLPGPRTAAALLLAALGTGTVLGSAAATAPAGTRAPILAYAPATATPSTTPAPTAAPSPAAASSSSLPDDTGEPTAAPAPAAPSSTPAPAPVTPAASTATVAQPTPEPTPDPTPEPTPEPTPTPSPSVPAAKHVVVVSLTGQDAATAFAADSPATYLTKDLREQGTYLAKLLPATTGSLANVLALLAGAAPTPEMQADCAQGGDACHVTAPSLPGELTIASKTWRGYAQGASAPCAAPPPGGFAAVRDPFPYLDDVADGCTDADVGLDALETDLASPRTAPALAWVVPDRCHDGHDADCPDAAADGDTGLARANTWLQTWVPRIIGSNAYHDGGMLVVLFDGGGPAESAALGAVVVSDTVRTGAVSRKPYDLYGLSRTLALALGVDPPGAAANDGVEVLGKDVFAAAAARSRNVDRSVTTP